jgi:hypothetical protein
MHATAKTCLLALGLAHAGAHGGCSPTREGVVTRPASSVAAGKRDRRPLRAQMLEAHNRRRARHCAPPLAWSNQLASVARSWAQRLVRKGCPLQHSDTPHGENLAAGSAGGFAPSDFVEMWYREVDDYSFRRARFSMATGHFTQLVWRSTRRVGCALAPCDNGLELLVCNYDPAGNVETLFEENVLPTSCR